MKKRDLLLITDLILTFILERRKLKAQEELAKNQPVVKDTTRKEEQ